jgi:hypothetical protein
MPTGQAFSKSSSAFSSTPVTKGETSNSDSEPPLQPTKQSKKPRIASSSDDDSDSKARVAQKRSAGGVKRGAKQPIKRGGKRF